MKIQIDSMTVTKATGIIMTVMAGAAAEPNAKISDFVEVLGGEMLRVLEELCNAQGMTTEVLADAVLEGKKGLWFSGGLSSLKGMLKREPKQQEGNVINFNEWRKPTC